MRNVRFQSLQCFATEDRVVDDSMVTFEIARCGYWPWSVDTKIEMRLVHIFEMRDGKISRELVFEDAAACVASCPATYMRGA